MLASCLPTRWANVSLSVSERPAAASRRVKFALIACLFPSGGYRPINAPRPLGPVISEGSTAMANEPHAPNLPDRRRQPRPRLHAYGPEQAGVAALRRRQAGRCRPRHLPLRLHQRLRHRKCSASPARWTPGSQRQPGRRMSCDSMFVLKAWGEKESFQHTLLSDQHRALPRPSASTGQI